MTTRARLVLPALMLCLVTSVPAVALDLGGHVRDGVVVGLLMGGGWNTVDYQLQGETPQSVKTGSAFSGGINVGWARNEYLVGSLGMYYWKKDFYNQITPVNASNFYLMAELSWFPMGEGLWVKGGIGLGDTDLTVLLPAERKSLGGNGWAYALGAGWEYRMSSAAAIGVGYDARWTDTGGSETFEYSESLLQSWSLSIRYYAD